MPIPRFETRVTDKQQFFRDNLTITEWLAVGGLLTSALFLMLGRMALVIPTIFVVFTIIDRTLMILNFKANPQMEGVLTDKFSAQLPNDDGTFGPKPAAQGVTVLLIGAGSNHPAGVFAPGFKELGDYFGKMLKELDERAEEFGVLGTSGWTGTAKPASNNTMTIIYFKNPE
jgi:hypothetical protein